MRVILQRVSEASVKVNDETVGSISEPGILALVGITHEDDEATVEKLAQKTWQLRILEGEKSCSDVNAPILAVSQFTLYGDPKKGRRPSWSKAAPGNISEPLYDHYVEHLRSLGGKVETGVFGADMKVSLVNDGPFTLILDSEHL